MIETYMKHPVHTVKPLDTIAHAREIMEAHRVNQLPVLHKGTLVGIVTDRDLRDAFPSVFDAAPAADEDPKQIPVESVMTANVVTLGPRDSVTAAATVMRRERIGAVPIVDAGRLVGIIARGDVLEAYIGLAQLAPSRGNAARS
jgi:acetoin utilization protein AcuB